MPKTVGGSVLPLKGGVADGTVCVYYFNTNIRNRLHKRNKKEITALS